MTEFSAANALDEYGQRGPEALYDLTRDQLEAVKLEAESYYCPRCREHLADKTCTTTGEIVCRFCVGITRPRLAAVR